jgi:hydrogenase maturation protease
VGAGERAVTSAVVVGIGQPRAGDDGVGIAVARALAARGIEVRESADAAILLSLLEERRRVVLVDAVVGGGEVGDVLHVGPEALALRGAPLSSHGVGVAQAIALSRALYGDEAARGVDVVAVVIERPRGLVEGLSPAVADAVPRAAELAARLARG